MIFFRWSRRGILAAFMIAMAVHQGTAWSQNEPAPKMSFDALADWTFYNRIGWMAFRRGNLERAGQCFRLEIEALRPFERTQSDLMARSYTEYSRVLYQQKRFADAEPLARWALSVREKSPGRDSAPLLENLDLMVKISHAKGHDSETVGFLNRELALKESIVGKGDPDLIPIIEQLAFVHGKQGNVAEAEPLYNRAQSLRETTAEFSLARAQDLQRQTEILAQIGSIGNGGRQQSQQQALITNRINVMNETAAAAREAVPDSISSAVSTEHFAAVLRNAGRTQEADSLLVKAKAMRDAAETRTARARGDR